MEYFIAIPSYKRARVCNNKTLKMLNTLGINYERINVFVIEEELEEYSKSLNPLWYNKLVIGEKGLVNQREFIENYYPINSHIISIDDDVTELDLTMTEFKSADEFFKYAFQECINNKSFIWGLYPVFNPFFRKSKQFMTTQLNFIIGAFYGIINRRTEDLKLQLTREGNKEDVERTILYYLKDKITLRFNKIGFKTKIYGSDGGGLGTFKNRIEIMKQDAILINQTYPELTKIKIRKNGLYEIVFKPKVPMVPVVESLIKSLKPDDGEPYYLDEIDPDSNLIKKILELVSRTTIKHCSNKTGRAKTFGPHRSITLGMIKARVQKTYGLSYQSKKHPELYEAIKSLGEQIVPFEFNAIHVNHNVVCPKHLDPNNSGKSVLVSIGDYEGCELEIEGKGIFNTKYKPLVFDGSKLPHWNTHH